MGENNVQDALEVFVSVIMYAAAVSVLVFAVSLYTGGLDFLEERIDEKQSVTIAKDVAIDTRSSTAQKDTFNKAEVVNSIIELDDPLKTSVRVNGSVLDTDMIIIAKDGDERGIKYINDKLGSYSSFERRNKYDTGAEGDYLQTVEFTGI